MKKIFRIIICTLIVICLASCGNNEIVIVSTYDKTAPEQMEELLDNDQFITLIPYYEMSDGTWKTDEYTYKYRLLISGRLSEKGKDFSYIYLSNIEEISFDQAWMATMSSNMDDRFDKEDAVWVAFK